MKGKVIALGWGVLVPCTWSMWSFLGPLEGSAAFLYIGWSSSSSRCLHSLRGPPPFTAFPTETEQGKLLHLESPLGTTAWSQNAWGGFLCPGLWDPKDTGPIKHSGEAWARRGSTFLLHWVHADREQGACFTLPTVCVGFCCSVEPGVWFVSEERELLFQTAALFQLGLCHAAASKDAHLYLGCWHLISESSDAGLCFQ